MSFLKEIKTVWPKSIRNQLILGIALVHLILLTIVVVDQLNRQKKFLKKQNYDQALSLVNDFAVNSSSYILANDIDGLERLVQSHKNFPNLKYAMFLSPDGLVLAHTNKKFTGLKATDSVSRRLKDTPQTQTLIENKDILDIAVPVLYNDKEIIGWARIGLGQDYIYGNLRAIVRNGILYIIMALVIGTLFAIIIANRLSRGLYKLMLTADKIRKGDRSTRVEPFRSIEISKLGMAFNQMLDEISANEKLLAKVLENMPVGVWILNEKGDIISANSASEKIWTGLKYVGLKDFGLFKGWFTDTGKIVEPGQWGAAIAITEGETVLNQEIEIECFDKTRKIILNSAIPLKEDDGRIIGAIAINVDVTDKKLIERNLYKINHDMVERVKELRCLYKISELSNDPGKTMEDILKGSIDIIPLAYQYPEIACVRITFDEHIYQSKNFKESTWKQEANIAASDGNIGQVQVFYTEQRPEEQEGPFLKEERFLINSIADILSNSAERKKAEVALRDQAETFEAIIENTSDSVLLISPEFKLLRFNKTARERIVQRRGERIFIGADFRKFLYPDAEEIFHVMFNDSLKGKFCDREIQAKDTNGNSFWIRAKTSPVYDRDNQLLGVTLLSENIDSQKKAQIALIQSEEKFRGLVEQSLVGVYIMQEEKFVYVNPGFEKIMGYSIDELKETSFNQWIYEEDIKKIKENYLSRVSGEKPTDQYTFRAVRRNGALLYIEAIVSKIIYGNRPAVIGTIVDITDHVEEEKRIGKAVNDAQEKERMQIGMELHDNVKQIMAASMINLDFLKNRLDDQNATKEILDKVIGYIREAMDEVRKLSHRLAPSIDSTIPLEEKIEILVNTMNAANRLKVYYRLDEFRQPVSDDVQLTIYRILQEQFNNILKYANASSVFISVKHRRDYIQLSIKDDGEGFSLSAKKNGIGFENIKRRVQVLDGQVKIFSAPGNGCEVNVQIPFR
ncbi:MAG TPA: PAS domain S-box protein [Chitinophagaceae bacterium]|nr:PAS domain S-box protein [Chitinophagaceae bacterium]